MKIGNFQSFELKIGEKQLKVETKLLGKHNILNIMGALAIAKQLKINPTDFKNIVQMVCESIIRGYVLLNEPMTKK